MPGSLDGLASCVAWVNGLALHDNFLPRLGLLTQRNPRVW
jgi:hypothetical protein